MRFGINLGGFLVFTNTWHCRLSVASSFLFTPLLFPSLLSQTICLYQCLIPEDFLNTSEGTDQGEYALLLNIPKCKKLKYFHFFRPAGFTLILCKILKFTKFLLFAYYFVEHKTLVLWQKKVFRILKINLDIYSFRLTVSNCLTVPFKNCFPEIIYRCIFIYS